MPRGAPDASPARRWKRRARRCAAGCRSWSLDLAAGRLTSCRTPRQPAPAARFPLVVCLWNSHWGGLSANLDRSCAPVRAVARPLTWALLPLAMGSALGTALDDHSRSDEVIGALLSWATWAGMLVAVLVPRTVSLTTLRIAAPAALAVAGWAAMPGDGGTASVRRGDLGGRHGRRRLRSLDGRLVRERLVLRRRAAAAAAAARDAPGRPDPVGVDRRDRCADRGTAAVRRAVRSGWQRSRSSAARWPSASERSTA